MDNDWQCNKQCKYYVAPRFNNSEHGRERRTKFNFIRAISVLHCSKLPESRKPTHHTAKLNAPFCVSSRFCQSLDISCSCLAFSRGLHLPLFIFTFVFVFSLGLFHFLFLFRLLREKLSACFSVSSAFLPHFTFPNVEREPFSFHRPLLLPRCVLQPHQLCGTTEKLFVPIWIYSLGKLRMCHSVWYFKLKLYIWTFW